MAFLHRLITDEAGVCMTDSRGMYSVVAALGVAALYLYGNRVPELMAYLDKVLPSADPSQFR